MVFRYLPSCVLLVYVVCCGLPVGSQALADEIQTSSDELRLERDLARVRREINDSSVFNAESCATYLDHNMRFLFERGAESYLPKTQAELMRLSSNAARQVEDLFALRLVLLDRLREFANRGKVKRDCIDNVRRALRYGRFVEELISEFLILKQETDLPKVPLQGGLPSFMLDLAQGPFRLRSGDVLVVRSSNFVGAAIARMGDEDGQFSHLAMVYVADDGEEFVIESLIRSGTAIVPLKKWLKEDRVRLLVLRHENRRLAEKAADEAHEFVETMQKTGEFVPYDYEMDSTNYDALYCSELIRLTYDRASGGKLILPTYPSVLENLHGTPFMESLGVSALTTFGPSDAEIEPGFHLVAEWRDLRKTATTRVHDAIITSMLEWMATRDYELTYKGFVQGAVDIYWKFLRPLGVGGNKIPSDIPRPFLKSVVALHLVATDIHRKVSRSLSKKLRNNPLALDYKEVLAAVESYRQEDCKRWLDYRKWREENPVSFGEADEPIQPTLHDMLRSSDEVGCRISERVLVDGYGVSE